MPDKENILKSFETKK